jgi:LysR family transcriptional regulator, regulator of abg operon
MQMQHILSLVALSEAGSLRSAAASLGRSQPGLTKNLRQIEDELGVRLFQRTSRGVIPTKIGQLVLARTRTIATDIRRLQEEVEQTKGGQHGTVSVCVSPFAATQIIPAALLVFRQRFPKVDVQISSGLFPVAIVALREGQTDIVIGPPPPADQCRSLIVEPLVNTDIVIVTSKSSPHAKARSIGDLSDADWLMIGSPGGPGDNIRAGLFRENGFRSPIARISSESYLAAFEIVQSLGLVCTFPGRFLREQGHRYPDLVVIPVRETISPLEISLLTRADVPPTPAAREMAACIRRRVNTVYRPVRGQTKSNPKR